MRKSTDLTVAGLDIRKSVEDIIAEHENRMRAIPGHHNYKLDRLDILLYLSEIESKARSPQVIQHDDMRKITLGPVYGKD